MKVLKEGNGQKEWSKSMICTGEGNNGGGCGAELLVSWGDLYKTYSSHYDGSNEVYITFCCCECNVETDVPKGLSIPKIAEIKDKVKETI